MTWQDVLKMMTPRMFLENVQGVIGGEVKGVSTSGSDEFTLDSDRGRVKVSRKGNSAYKIVFGTIVMTGYNLSKLLPEFLDKLDSSFEKVAGTVAAGNPAHAPLFSEGRMGGRKNAKDEEKD